MMLVLRRYLPNSVGTHLQLSRLRRIGVNKIALSSKPNNAQCGYRTHDARVDALAQCHGCRYLTCCSDGWPVCVPQPAVADLKDLKAEESGEVASLTSCLTYLCNGNIRCVEAVIRDHK